MLAWTEQIKCRGLSEQPNGIRVATKSYNKNSLTWINMNHSSSLALERLVINNGGGGGLNRFYMAITTPSASAVVHNIQLVLRSSW